MSLEKQLKDKKRKKKKISETRGMSAQQKKLLFLVSDCKDVRKLWFRISVGTVDTD